MRYWKCTVCGYIHEAEEAPEMCPLCASTKDKFVESDYDGNPLSQQEPAQSDVKQTAQSASAPQQKTEARPNPAPVQATDQTPFDRAAALIMQHHLHPISVHTPNGVLPFAFILLALATLFGVNTFESAAFYSLIFVLLAMPAVLFTGYVAWQKRYRGALTKTFKIKIGAAAVSSITLMLLVIWRLVNPASAAPETGSSWLFLLLTLICLGAAGIAGHMGGKLVFGARK